MLLADVWDCLQICVVAGVAYIAIMLAAWGGAYLWSLIVLSDRPDEEEWEDDER